MPKLKSRLQRAAGLGSRLRMEPKPAMSGVYRNETKVAREKDRISCNGRLGAILLEAYANALRTPASCMVMP